MENQPTFNDYKAPMRLGKGRAYPPKIKAAMRRHIGPGGYMSILCAISGNTLYVRHLSSATPYRFDAETLEPVRKEQKQSKRNKRKNKKGTNNGLFKF